MEKFYFERPSIKRKNEIIEFLDEFVKNDSDINGSGFLDRIYYGYTFEEALNKCLNMENKDFAKSINCAQSKTFLLIRENDNKIIGIITIRWNLPKSMNKFGSNIGYSIRPTERRKGYNKINLYFGLLELQKMGLDNIKLDCDANNIGSYKTMEALGGKLVLEEIDPFDGILTRLYSFNLEECIENNKSKYNKFIIK